MSRGKSCTGSLPSPPLPRRPPTRNRADADAPRARGSEVNTTHMVRVAGSAHAIVPVEPVCPKVFSEHPAPPKAAPTSSPRPRDFSPGGLWFFTISLAVSGLTAAPFSFRNSPRKRARTGAEACVPPQGAPSFRQYRLFQSHFFAVGSPPPDSGAARSVWHTIMSSSANRPRPCAECFIPSGSKTVRSMRAGRSVPLRSSATCVASRIAMLEYWYFDPGANCSGVRIPPSINSASGACFFRSSLFSGN
jgi:hypothetical protein